MVCTSGYYRLRAEEFGVKLRYTTKQPTWPQNVAFFLCQGISGACGHQTPWNGRGGNGSERGCKAIGAFVSTQCSDASKGERWTPANERFRTVGGGKGSFASTH